jgi:predicted HicB family RNase H-like nuclease
MKTKHNKNPIFQDFNDSQLLEVYKNTLLKISEMSKGSALDFIEELQEANTELQMVVLECTERGLAMPREKTKTRISVPLSLEVYKQIEEESKRIGVSMATYIAFMIGSQMDVKKSMLNSVGSSLDAMIRQQEENGKKLTPIKLETK